MIKQRLQKQKQKLKMASTQNFVYNSPERVLCTDKEVCPGAPKRSTTRTRFESSSSSLEPINLFPDTSGTSGTSDASDDSDASDTSDDSVASVVSGYSVASGISGYSGSLLFTDISYTH